MKIHLAWIRRTAAAAIVAGASVSPAAAQYAPYRPIQQTPAAPVQPAAQPAPRVAAQQPYWQQAAQQSAAQRYQAPTAAQYPTTSGAYVPTATPATTAAYAPRMQYTPAAAQYSAAQYPQYPTGYPQVAQQSTPEQAPTPATTVEEMPAPVGATNGTNGTMNGHTNGHMEGAGDYHGYANGGHSYQAGSYYGGAQCSDEYGISDYFDQSCHDSQWFGGLYFLFMERDNQSPQKLTVRVDHAAVSDPYYPLGHTTVMSTHDTDQDFREGVEVRFGSTFTILSSSDTCDSGCYNGCNSCQPCAADVYAWEVAWWGLDDSPEDVTYRDAVMGDDVRIYGMKNFNGLEYDRDGTGGATWAYRPVNDYYGYQLPIPDPGAGPYPDGYVAVVAQRVRTNFKAQNLELNIIRFPVCDMACGGCDTCNTGCDPCNSCEPCAPASCFSAYGSCGVRYFRADDDFMYATAFGEWDAGASDMPTGHDGWTYDNSNELYYDIQVDNQLIGPQLGWTMNYCVACKWNFFANSTFGVFNNHIEQVQRMWSGGGGDVRFTQTGQDFNVESDKNDISFLGEMRLGGSYDINCNWRAVAAYRAVAITGLANSTDQIPSDFTNYEYVQIIDSDSSVIVHGVQVGAECRY
jgi:hypothetical protein